MLEGLDYLYISELSRWPNQVAAYKQFTYEYYHRTTFKCADRNSITYGCMNYNERQKLQVKSRWK